MFFSLLSILGTCIPRYIGIASKYFWILNHSLDSWSLIGLSSCLILILWDHGHITRKINFRSVCELKVFLPVLEPLVSPETLELQPVTTFKTHRSSRSVSGLNSDSKKGLSTCTSAYKSDNNLFFFNHGTTTSQGYIQQPTSQIYRKLVTNPGESLYPKGRLPVQPCHKPKSNNNLTRNKASRFGP